VSDPARVDERIGMEYYVPEPYEDFLARTGLSASVCTFCKRFGKNKGPAYIVLLPWKGRDLGQLQTYCDELHHFDPKLKSFYSSATDTPLRPVCPEHNIELPATGVCDDCV
jgi:hypothetical protein